ncbi:MAG: hypothetical protein SH847_00125 [Roseiflexaceae bacterium]|nr:hypothetical protein [Roseiflexaceae bacterium]
MPARQYKIALQTFQSARLRRDHADLAAEPQYQAIGEFFFNEMYGPRDFAARDDQARRLRQFIHVVPGLTMRDVEPALQLLDISNRLDEIVVHHLITMCIGLDFDEQQYDQAYHLSNNYAERLTQLELVRTALYNVFRTGGKPLIRIGLERTEQLAHMVGMAEIHRFLKHGYAAIQPVQDIYRFVETIYVREKDRLDWIYEVS